MIILGVDSPKLSGAGYSVGIFLRVELWLRALIHYLLDRIVLHQ